MLRLHPRNFYSNLRKIAMPLHENIQYKVEQLQVLCRHCALMQVSHQIKSVHINSLNNILARNKKF